MYYIYQMPALTLNVLVRLILSLALLGRLAPTTQSLNVYIRAGTVRSVVSSRYQETASTEEGIVGETTRGDLLEQMLC